MAEKADQQGGTEGLTITYSDTVTVLEDFIECIECTGYSEAAGTLKTALKNGSNNVFPTLLANGVDAYNKEKGTEVNIMVTPPYLPQECWHNVAASLSLFQENQLAASCKSYHLIASTDPGWQQKCRHIYFSKITNEEIFQDYYKTLDAPQITIKMHDMGRGYALVAFVDGRPAEVRSDNMIDVYSFQQLCKNLEENSHIGCIDLDLTDYVFRTGQNPTFDQINDVLKKLNQTSLSEHSLSQRC